MHIFFIIGYLSTVIICNSKLTTVALTTNILLKYIKAYKQSPHDCLNMIIKSQFIKMILAEIKILSK